MLAGSALPPIKTPVCDSAMLMVLSPAMASRVGGLGATVSIVMLREYTELVLPAASVLFTPTGLMPSPMRSISDFCNLKNHAPSELAVVLNALEPTITLTVLSGSVVP